MNEQDLIALLKKPPVRAALREIMDSFDDDDIQAIRKSREALERKLLNDRTLHQEILDEMCRNQKDFSAQRKFPIAFYSAAISVSNQLRDAEHRNDSSGL
ncbi:hypothetical protein C2808_06530 [Pasteurella multocida]|nr:hypothetical protein [Pasteurella multocida]NNI33451.1 hypothetical protein [Pasteurella multocida]